MPKLLGEFLTVNSAMDGPLPMDESNHFGAQPGPRRRRARASRARLLEFLVINRQSPVTVVDQVATAIEHLIVTGGLKSGDLLPSTRELARTLDIGRATALSVIARLSAEGFVETRVGSGSRVRARSADLLTASAAPAPSSLKRSQVPGAVAIQQQVALLDTLPKHVSRSTSLMDLQGLSVATPFAPGMPAIDQFPYHTWSDFCAKSWKHATAAMLETRDPAGYRPLREALAGYLASARGVRCTADQVIIVSGAQHAFDLTLRVLTQPGDRVLIEDPGFLGARNAMLSAGLNLRGVPLDEEGVMVPDDNGGAKLLYTTPSHQYPMGRTMSLARRRALLEWARRTSCFIFEDDYSSEFRYDGKPLPSLQGADEYSRVIYAGTFNKIMFPSLRLGYLVVPEELVDVFLSIRTWSDGCPPGVIQAAMLQFIERGAFYSHIRRLREIYAARHSLLCELISERMGLMLSVISDPAGLNLAAVAKRPIDDVALSRRARNANIVCPPLSQYFVQAEPQRGFQFGFASSNEAQMRAAIDRLEVVWGQGASTAT